jgi:hypothetical protein
VSDPRRSRGAADLPSGERARLLPRILPSDHEPKTERRSLVTATALCRRLARRRCPAVGPAGSAVNAKPAIGRRRRSCR